MQSPVAEQRFANLASDAFVITGGEHRRSRSGLAALREITHRRELLNLLVRRELKARYKDSSFGLLWSLMRPLAQFLVYYFAIGQVLGLARAIPNFAIFVFIGLSAWTLFTEVVNNATTSITGNAGLVKKVYLPREIFPLAAVGGALFNFVVQLLVLLVAMLVTTSLPTSWDVLYALLGLAVLLVWSVAIGLLLSAINVYMRDIQHLTEVALIILFWASPIVYAFHFVHDKAAGTILELIYLANPITIGILGMQKGLWVDGSLQKGATNFPSDLDPRLWIALAVGLVAVALAERVFARLQANFAQEL